MSTEKRWTCAEFHRLGDAGHFEHSRPLLIDGQILELLLPTPQHTAAKTLTEDAFKAVFTTGFVVRTENPLVLGLSTDPVPDVAVVIGSTRDYAKCHPTTALLVVEISDSSLDFDLDTKASLYASAGIADYWVVDLVHRRVVVHRDPAIDAAGDFGFNYTMVTTFDSGDVVVPLAIPAASISVDDLLP